MIYQRITFLLFVTLVPLAVDVILVAIAFAIRRLNRRISMSLSLVFLHGIAVLATVIPIVFVKEGLERLFGNIYITYIIYPGLIPAYLNTQFSHLWWPWLTAMLGDHKVSILCNVAIPALMTFILGSLFWIWVGKFLGQGKDTLATTKYFRETHFHSKKKNKVLLLLTVLMFLGGMDYWLKPRYSVCQRCGAGLRMCGPLICGIQNHYMSGAAGDVMLYCSRHGHIIVKKYNPNNHISDWKYHKDSYDKKNEISSKEMMKDLGN